MICSGRAPARLLLTAGMSAALVLTACTPGAPGPNSSSAPTTTTAPSSNTPSVSPTPSATTSTPPTSNPEPIEDPRHYGNLLPYPAPDQDLVETPPGGYSVAFVEHLGRHGSRALTDPAVPNSALKLWRRAKKADALTETGRGLGPAMVKLEAAMNKVGYGNISGLGASEQRGLGSREGKRYADYFTASAKAGDHVKLLDSGRLRAKESGENFAKGLGSTNPDLKIRDSKSDEDMLHFDTEDDTYEKFLDDDQSWRKAYQKSLGSIDLRKSALQGLRAIYTDDFVAKIPNPVTQADYLFDVYRIAPGMTKEAALDMTPFLSPQVAKALAYNDDARYYYSRGPGQPGDDRSYAAAEVVLTDFVEEAQERLDGDATAAVYRFAHAEEITPFAALLGLPGNDQLAKGKVFSYDDSDFRLATTSPLSANIHWTLWTSKDSGPALVSVSTNERPATLRSACKPYKGTTNFYEFDDLESCLTTR